MSGQKKKRGSWQAGIARFNKQQVLVAIQGLKKSLDKRNRLLFSYKDIFQKESAYRSHIYLLQGC